MSSLPEAERQAFLAEAAATLRECATTGNFAAFDALVADWANTAEIWSDPDLAAALQGAVPEPVNVGVDMALGWSEMYSLALHRLLAVQLPDEFETWKPKLLSNIDRLRRTNKGEPHLRNIDRWSHLVEQDNIEGLLSTMLDPNRDGQEMREVGPFTGLLPEDEREQALKEARQ